MRGGVGLSGWRVVLVLSIGAAGCGRAEFFGPLSPVFSTSGDGGLSGGCTPGQACIPANRCELGQTACVGGVLQCQSLGQPDFSADGQSCQQTGICQAGVCQACAAGVACVPPNVCHLGSTVCATGQSSCQDTGAPNPSVNGTSCGSNLVCNDGACVACSAGASCKTECRIGTVSCATGTPVCVNPQPDPAAEGLPCSNGGICHAGACVPPQAGRPPFPQVPDQGGSVLASPEVVTITFQDYPHRSAVEAFANWIVGSSWLSTVGADYGVGSGSAVPPVELVSDAPSSATQDDVETFLAMGISAGTMPSPSSLGGQGIYLIYYPQGTQLSTFFGDSCSAFTGYHNFFTLPNGIDVVYGVIADCAPFALDEIERVGSHEIIEAATDPHPRGIGPPTAYAIGDVTSSWATSLGPEVADLCESLGLHDASGFPVQRVWSNRAAKGSGSPCVPAPSAPFFTVSMSPDSPQQLPAGGSFQFTVTGWSDTPNMGAWNLVVLFGGFATNPQLGAFTITSGGTTELTLTVPSNAAPGTVGWAAIQSVDTAGQAVSLWPAVVVAQ